MEIWSNEIKELEKIDISLKGQYPKIGKELGQLIKSDDPIVILLYARRCLEVIITDVCEFELKRERGTEPLKGIIDKLNKEKKIPSHIITSMHGLNDLSVYGTHPKDFDPGQVKPVLSNLDIILKWYIRYIGLREKIILEKVEEPLSEINISSKREKRNLIQNDKTLVIVSTIFLVVLIVIAVLFFTRTSGGDNLSKELEKSVAILPFRNDTPVDSNKYFINGVMEDILNDLQRIKDLRVISRTSVEKYRDNTKSIPEIAKELGVNYIVEGSGQKSGNKIRLSVQLLRASNEDHLWGDSYEKDLHDAKDIFDIQRQIAESITTELQAVISPEEKHLIEKIPTMNLDAWEAVTKGNFYLKKFTKNDFDTALKYFEIAKEKDPDYAPAYNGISAVWYLRQQGGFVSPAEATPKIREYNMKALEHDNNHNLAAWYVYVVWDWEKGEKEYLRAIELNTNNAEERAKYSLLLCYLGRIEEALKQVEVAAKLDPLNPLLKIWHGEVLYFARKYDEAIKVFQDILKIEKDYPLAHANLVGVFHLLGKYNEALKEYKLSVANDTDLVNALEKGNSEGSYKGALLAYNKVAEQRYKNSYWSPLDIAINYVFVEDKDKAFYWLNQAYKVHDPGLPFIQAPYIYDYLHGDPRFQDLCKRMRLPYK